MALTRKALSAMGIEEEIIEQIIAMHTETTDGLKDKINQYKAEAEKLPAVQKELDELREQAKGGERSPYKAKYEALVGEKEALQAEFDKYKADIEAKQTKEVKREAYRALLKEAGVSEKRIESVLKVSDIDGVELDKDGKIKDADKRKDGIKEEWADFISTETTKGADTATPPVNNGGSAGQPSFAARLAQQYHDNLYGSNATAKEDGK